MIGSNDTVIFRKLTEEGKTILFVSHNLYAIQTFCRTVIWLERGRVREIGPAKPVVSSYQVEAAKRSDPDSRSEDRDSPEVTILEIEVNAQRLDPQEIEW